MSAFCSRLEQSRAFHDVVILAILATAILVGLETSTSLIVTLEGWADMQKNVLPGHPWAWIYFASFIVLAVFVVVNLFIAVVINNLETAKEQEEASEGNESSRRQVELQLKQVRGELGKLESLLKRAPP